MIAPTQSYPLVWPAGWPTHRHKLVSPFRPKGIGEARDSVLDELRKLRAEQVVISTNLRTRIDGLPAAAQRPPDEPGVAVYFKLKGKQLVLACDKWHKVEHNLWAIARHVEALRGQQRWGVGSVEQAFAGYTAIPERTGGRAWNIVLGVEQTATIEQVRDAYRKLVKIYHPDGPTGSNEKMVELNAAYTLALKQFGQS